MEGQTYKIQIGEHVFETPPEPPHKEILFWKNKKADQYWTRQKDFPQIWSDWWIDEATGGGVELDAPTTRYESKTLVQLSKEDTALLFDQKEETGKEGLQEREMRRRVEGVWFYNNGEPTYITGNHYFALQWGQMRGGTNTVEPGSSYGMYYEFQRDMCYLFEIAKTTESGRGLLLVKPKKTGLTQLVSLICLNEGSTRREKNIRIMSITESIAREVNFSLIKYAMQKMPNILMPSRSKLNESEVIFGPANSIRAQLKKRKETNLSPLNTWICTVPSAKGAFDTLTNYLCICDEWPKYKENVYPQELFDITIETVREGFKRLGCIYAMSYVPEHSDRSFREARKIFKESKLNTRKRDENGNYYGETTSKLLCHTLLVQSGLFNCCSVYGKPILEKIWSSIKQEQEDAKGDPQKLQSLRRVYPSSEADVWRDATLDDALFDNLRLDTQMQEMEEQIALGMLPYEQFNLSYLEEPRKNPIGTYYSFNTSIVYEQITHDQIMKGMKGHFKWYDKDLTPAWFMDKHRGKITVDKKTGLLMPNEQSPFFVSIDPTTYRQKRYTTVGSMNAMYAFVMPNAELNGYMGADVSNRRPFIEYHFRRDSPNDTLHDFIRLILFLGCRVLIEANVTTWTEDLIEMGLGNFLLLLNKEGALVPWTGRDDQKFLSSQNAIIDQYVASGQKHLSLQQGNIDSIKQIKSPVLLEQLQSIRKEDTKEWDCAVSYLLGLYGIDSFLGWKQAQDDLKRKRGNGMMGLAAARLMR